MLKDKNTLNTNTKRIANNTIVLYIRMIVVMLITLYTSRIVLKALGVDDFGLYNVVGGVIGLLTFFNRTMEKSTQRFLNVSMVKGDDALSSIFSSSVTIHLLFAILFLILGESLGIWFLNTKVVIPAGRELAANIVFQASLLSVCISFLIIPYSATVIAYEKMSILAAVSIIDAVLKLGIAFVLLSNKNDRLILYGILLLGIQLVNFAMYFVYCNNKSKIFRFRLSYNKDNFKQIFSFVSWTLLGQMAVVVCNHGNVILVNMFHSLVANAAMSVGSQVNHAVTNLTLNFQTAFNPQITKSFAERNFVYLRSLVFITSKISFCIMFAAALPIVFNMDWILDIWLDTVPHLSNTFAILFIINGIINAISMPFNYVVLSSGEIRNFQIVTSIVFLLDLPITYILFYYGMPVVTVMWVKIGIISIMFFVRVFFASRIVEGIKIKSVFIELLAPMMITGGVILIMFYLLNIYAHTQTLRLEFTILSEIVCLIMIWFICLNKNERSSLLKHLMIKKNK